MWKREGFKIEMAEKHLSTQDGSRYGLCSGGGESHCGKRKSGRKEHQRNQQNSDFNREVVGRGSCLDPWPGLVNCLPSHSSAPSTFHRMEARSWAPRRQLCPPGITWLALASLLSCLLASSKAKVFSRCELAKELHVFGLDGYRGYNLADWVCLAYFTSGFNTAAVDHEADGSTNNGIFQISSRKWCKNLTLNGPNLCRIYCTDLLSQDLKDSVICVMKIVQEPQGLGYWEAWRHHCQGRDLSDWVDGCDF